MRLSKFVLSVFLASALGACASAPTQEMSDARLALRAAEDAGAQDYAAPTLSAAQGTIADAERQLESGKYVRARNYAILARAEAMKARSVALAIAQAKAAVDEAARLHALSAAAQAALKNAREAAGQDRPDRALAEAERAAELARQDSNGARLEAARRLLGACTEAQRAANGGLIENAQKAVAAGDGKAAEEYARRACGGAAR